MVEEVGAVEEEEGVGAEGAGEQVEGTMEVATHETGNERKVGGAAEASASYSSKWMRQREVS